MAESILRDPQNEVVASSQGGGIRHWRLMLKGKEIDLVASSDVQPLPLATFPNVNFTIRQQANQMTMQGVLPSGLKISKTLTLSS